MRNRTPLRLLFGGGLVSGSGLSFRRPRDTSLRLGGGGRGKGRMDKSRDTDLPVV